MNGERIKSMRNAGDTVIFADSLDRLQQLMSGVKESSRRYGLDISVNKTKLRIVYKNKFTNCNLNIN